MPLKLWLMFLVPTVGSLLTCLLSATGNNIAIVVMAAFVAGLSGIVQQLPESFRFLGRAVGSANTGRTVLRDLGLGFATGCLSFVLTFFMPLMLYSGAVADAIYYSGIPAERYQVDSVIEAIFYYSLLGAVPLNGLIGATIIAAAQRPWLAALTGGAGFAVSSITVNLVDHGAVVWANLAANPGMAAGVIAAYALTVAFILFLGALARQLIVGRSPTPHPVRTSSEPTSPAVGEM